MGGVGVFYERKLNWHVQNGITTGASFVDFSCSISLSAVNHPTPMKVLSNKQIMSPIPSNSLFGTATCIDILDGLRAFETMMKDECPM